MSGRWRGWVEVLRKECHCAAMTPAQQTAEVWFSKTGLSVLTALVFGAAVLFFPAIVSRRIHDGKSAEKNDVVNLVAAIKAYQQEYGHYPFPESDGVFTAEQRQGQLMRVLAALDTTANPKKIVFFEGRKANEKPIAGRPRYTAGFSPESGALMDPWGSPYQIISDNDGDGQIATPYSDDNGPVHRGAIAWSLGKDRVQGSRYDRTQPKSSDDVGSWF